ncbi:MAG: imidazole glycerol phosphate synthase subunit HisH [Gammaproteobacteria bacterium]
MADTIAVIDYGMGNLRSVAKALEKVCDAKVLVTADPDLIRKADRVVFPGVGAIRDCMQEIGTRGIEEVVREVAAQKPFLGICLGMQLLMRHSEENDGCDALGILPGEVKYFGDDLLGERMEKLKVPHMGWNQVHQTCEHPLWQGIAQDGRFYFVHSYYVRMDDEKLVAGRCEYGVEFAAAVARDNIFAVQFHPEKSQLAGLTLLANFTRWDGTLPAAKIH